MSKKKTAFVAMLYSSVKLL